MSQPTSESVRQDALRILQTLQDNALTGASNRLPDVKSTLEAQVGLEIDTYFFFLRKFHYVAMDREANVRLTDAADAVLTGDMGRFEMEVDGFFADRLGVIEDLPEPPADTASHGKLGYDDDEDDEPTSVFESRTISPDVLPFAPPGEEELPDEGDATGPIRLAPEPFESAPETPDVTEITMSPTTPRRRTSGSRPTPIAPPSAVSDRIDARFERGEELGNGPMGTVYAGTQTSLGVPVAIKEFKDIFGYFSFLQRNEVLGRLEQELRAQASLQHPSVVRLLDRNVEVERPYFVTERLAGNLREKLTDAGEAGLDVKWAVRAFLQAAYGLRAAHAAGFTHHNLKPENLLLDTRGNVHLADFGLSRIMEVDATLPQVFLGAGGMPYLAPELLAREPDAGVAADVYGLGILLYEMLTGQVPGRRSPLPSEVNHNVPAGLDAIFDRMTQDKRDQRFPDLDAMLEEFYGVFPSGEHLTRGELIVSG